MKLLNLTKFSEYVYEYYNIIEEDKLKEISLFIKEIIQKSNLVQNINEEWLITFEPFSEFIKASILKNTLNEYLISNVEYKLDSVNKSKNQKFLKEILPIFDKANFVRSDFFKRFILTLETKNSIEFNNIMKIYNNIISNSSYTIEDKYNKLLELKNNEIVLSKNKSQLLRLRKELNKVKELSKTDWICSIDCEYKNDEIAEIGITLKNTKLKKLIVKNYIVEDYIHKKNKYIRFNYGISEVLPLDLIFKDILELTKNTKIIVGNSIVTDIKLLSHNGLNLKDKLIFDLNDFNKYFHKDLTGGSNLSLDLMCNELNIKSKNFHNAGNDSYYSIRAFYKLAKKYEELNFNISNYKTKSKKIMIKEKREKNISIDIDRKIIMFKNLYKKVNDFKNVNHEKLDRSELMPITKLHFFFQEIEPKIFYNGFEKFLKKIHKNNINFKIFEDNIYMNIENFIYFYKSLNIYFNKENGINDVKTNDFIKDFFLTEIKINKNYENSDKYILNFYKNNLTDNINEIKFFEFQTTETKKKNNHIFLETFKKEPEKYDLLNKILNHKDLNSLNSTNLLKLLKEQIKTFNKEEMPYYLYENILENIFQHQRENFKFIEYTKLEHLKNVDFIEITDSSKIFNFLTKNKAFINFEKYFNPNIEHLPNIKNKVKFVSYNKRIFVDFNSFIFLIKNFIEIYKIRFDRHPEFSKNLINYIKNNQVKDLDFSFDCKNIILNNHFEINKEENNSILNISIEN